ncbi:MAG: TDT family transporter [Ezakiella sp.]|nr:TDT family transporter [Ezakiella sp.]
MKNFLKRIPLPITGVALGLLALGNLLQSYNETVRLVLGAIGGIFVILAILKIIFLPEDFKEDMKNPITASVFLTTTMALMLIAGYLKPYIGGASKIIWYIAIASHIALMIFFTVRFIFNFDLKKVFSSYYIVYVGIAVASITAPAFDSLNIGKIAFWFGIVTFAILFLISTKRYMTYREIPDPAKPIICITAAPMSLCLAGYNASFETKSTTFVIIMLAIASVLYIYSLIKAIGYLRLPFFPSYAAFTFPFVISAIAMKSSIGFMTKAGLNVAWLKPVSIVQIVIATALTIYVAIRYIIFIFASKKA